MDKIRGVFRKMKSGVKKYMSKTIDACKEVLSNKESRLVVGLSFIGLGVALTMSVYMKIPN